MKANTLSQKYIFDLFLLGLEKPRSSMLREDLLALIMQLLRKV